jgi:hypothetical protein
MNLTPSERAAMVRDLENMANGHKWQQSMREGKDKQFHKAMSANYSALASAIKEGLTFNEVA